MDANNSTSKPLDVAIVGCGAVSRMGHLPGAARAKHAQVTLLIDTDIDRARELADEFDIPNVASTTENLSEHADAAVLALPHSLHASVSIDLLSKGTHVLVEKPMATSTAECDAMIAAADQSGAVLAVGLVRRFRWVGLMLKRLIDLQSLGRVLSFDMREGSPYNWPSASSFVLKRESAGGGATIGNGSHALDSIIWWFGEPLSFDYFDDDYGGCEADSLLKLRTPNDVEGIVELSRTRSLRNSTIVRFEHGELEVPAYGNGISLSVNQINLGFSGEAMPLVLTDGPEQHLDALMADQFDDWANAIATGTQPAVSGREGRRSIALIEACYANRQPLSMPWIQPDSPLINPSNDQAPRNDTTPNRELVESQPAGGGN